MTEPAPPDFDATLFKAIERRGYNLIAARYGLAAAARDRAHRALVSAAAIEPGHRVLDIASGPGTLAGLAAARTGRHGLVIATDIAEQALGVVRRDAESRIACAATDAEKLCLADGAVDRVLCGLGLMFFPHPGAALAEARRVLAPGGMLALSVWGPEAATPLVACALATLRRVLPPPKVARPSVFRFGDAALLAKALERAGFTGVSVAPVELDSAFADAASYWQAFLDLAGGAAWSLAQLPTARRDELAAAVAEELLPYRQGDGYRMASRVLVASGRRPDERRL